MFVTLPGDATLKDARGRRITSAPDILGGTPVIAGTRRTDYAVLGRLQDGIPLMDTRRLIRKSRWRPSRLPSYLPRHTRFKADRPANLGANLAERSRTRRN